MIKDPSGKLFNLFMLMVWDKKIGEVLAEQGIVLLRNETFYENLTFCELRVEYEHFYIHVDADYELFYVQHEFGSLRGLNKGLPFDYIKYIKKHNEVENEEC